MTMKKRKDGRIRYYSAFLCQLVILMMMMMMIEDKWMRRDREHTHFLYFQNEIRTFETKRQIRKQHKWGGECNADTADLGLLSSFKTKFLSLVLMRNSDIKCISFVKVFMMTRNFICEYITITITLMLMLLTMTEVKGSRSLGFFVGKKVVDFFILDWVRWVS